MGILNYIRLGFEVVQRVRGAPQRPPASQNAGVAADAAVRTASPVPLHVPPPDLRLAVAWQLNKNLLVKAKVDSQDLAGASVRSARPRRRRSHMHACMRTACTRTAVAAAFKSWAHPTVTVAGSVGYDMVRRSPRVGAEVRVENVGTPRYQLPQPEYRCVRWYRVCTLPAAAHARCCAVHARGCTAQRHWHAHAHHREPGGTGPHRVAGCPGAKHGHRASGGAAAALDAVHVRAGLPAPLSRWPRQRTSTCCIYTCSCAASPCMAAHATATHILCTWSSAAPALYGAWCATKCARTTRYSCTTAP